MPCAVLLVPDCLTSMLCAYAVCIVLLCLFALCAVHNADSSSQPLLASCAGDCEVRLHDLQAAATVRVFTPHTGACAPPTHRHRHMHRHTHSSCNIPSALPQRTDTNTDTDTPTPLGNTHSSVALAKSLQPSKLLGRIRQLWSGVEWADRSPT